MKEKKIRILLIPSDLAGVGSFRSIWPGQQIQKGHSDEFDVEINHTPNVDNLAYLTQFDIIHFHRSLGSHEKMPQLFKKIRESGTKLIMDIDDYWSPPTSHPLYAIAVQEKMAEKATETMKNVDWVTTTTNIFANYIKPYNKNVYVLVNAIDVKHRMWQPENTKTNDKTRFSVICGSSHLKDLENLSTSMNVLHHDTNLKDKYQMVMCGYDIRGYVTEILPNNERKTRKLLPHESVWNQFESILTNNYACTNQEYTTWLKRCENKPYPFGDQYKETYIRRWTLPLTQYGKHYNYCDVSLAPLAENTFNEVKSELKIIEAGLTKKVLIAQDYGIYKELLTQDKTGLLVPTSQNERGWYEEMKKLIVTPKLREEIAENLYNFVKDRYNLEKVTKDRVEFYKSLLK